MSDTPLFQDADEFEETYVGEEREEQPNQPPLMPNPALEHGMLTTPPYLGNKDGIRSQPIDQGALGETDLTEASRLKDPTNADGG